MSWKHLLDEVFVEEVRDTTGRPVQLEKDAQFVQEITLQHLAAAERHYTGRGYSVTSIPWVVSEAAYYTTLPAEAEGYTTQGGYLVGSAEHSFIQLLLEGKAVGKRYAFSPCFRHETHDAIHLPYFAKLELIQSEDVSLASLGSMVEDAVDYFSQYLPVNVVLMPEGNLDVVSAESGLELGSYGIRGMNYEGRWISWVYGTGCAEPRLSQALAEVCSL